MRTRGCSGRAPRSSSVSSKRAAWRARVRRLRTLHVRQAPERAFRPRRRRAARRGVAGCVGGTDDGGVARVTGVGGAFLRSANPTLAGPVREHLRIEARHHGATARGRARCRRSGRTPWNPFPVRTARRGSAEETGRGPRRASRRGTRRPRRSSPRERREAMTSSGVVSVRAPLFRSTVDVTGPPSRGRCSGSATRGRRVLAVASGHIFPRERAHALSLRRIDPVRGVSSPSTAIAAELCAARAPLILRIIANDRRLPSILSKS
jgi:hypothetical protein